MFISVAVIGVDDFATVSKILSTRNAAEDLSEAFVISLLSLIF
jgi:hypothetical protein